jgi:hypothetical protein
MSSNRISSLALALLAVVITLAGSAKATFPGKNGRIVFDEGPDIWTMNPDGSDERQLTSFGSSGASACCAAYKSRACGSCQPVLNSRQNLLHFLRGFSSPDALLRTLLT